jgi:hypothetical protein
MTDESQQVLSEQQAFEAMRSFLEAYYNRFKTASLADVLSDIGPPFLTGAVTADPAMWSDWQAAVKLVLG